MELAKKYYTLVKPGIVRGNALMAIAGFLFASHIDDFNLELMLVMLIGLSLIIASGCVFNNYLDRGIDKKMERTKKRALPAESISIKNALIYGTFLGLLGVLVLGIFTNTLTTVVAVTGFIFYVIVYGIAKRKTVYGTIVGSISGAIPPVVGYTAVTQSLDKAALLLFLILVLWQMPHFYAIAMYRIKDYKAANIPVLPIVRGMKQTKIRILLYIVAFTLVSLLPTIYGYAGVAYAIIIGLSGLSWFIYGAKSLSQDDTKWAKRMFSFSLIVIMSFLGAILANFLTK